MGAPGRGGGRAPRGGGPRRAPGRARADFARRREIAPLDPAGNAEKLRALAPAPFAPPCRRRCRRPAVPRANPERKSVDRRWPRPRRRERLRAAARRTRQAARRHRRPTGRAPLGVASADNLAGALQARLLRADADGRPKGVLRALDAKAARSAKRRSISARAASTDAQFDLPVELRNQIVARSSSPTSARPAPSGCSTNARAAGASRSPPAPAPTSPSRCCRPPIISGARSRPSPTSASGGTAARDPIVSLLAEKPSVLALADMSVAAGPGARRARRVRRHRRRAAPLRRHAARRRRRRSDADRARRGGRTLGGALSWETPKHIAPFDKDSPFFGLAAPDEVTVSRQVLAEPEPGLADKTWARLADGTPLVTAAPARQGPDRPLPRHRRHDLVEPAVVGPVRRHAAPDRRARRRRAAGRASRAETPAREATRRARGARSTASARSAPRRPKPQPIGADFAGAGDAAPSAGLLWPAPTRSKRSTRSRRAQTLARRRLRRR